MKRGIVTLVLLATSIGVACRPPVEPGFDHVRAIVMPYLTLMPFHIAEAEGYFEEQRLDVEFVHVARNQEIMTALATGDVDVAGGMLTVNELSLAATGARLRMVASLGAFSPDACTNAALMVRRDLFESGALEDPAQIRGLRIDTDDLTPIGYWTDVFLGRFNLTLDDVEVVNLPSPAAVEAAVSGTIDVTVEAEPFLTLLETTGEAVAWARMEDVLPNFVVAMMMYGPTLLDDRPEIGERLAVAMLKAIRHYQLGKTPENLATVERGTGLSAEQVAAACWPVTRHDARIDPAVFRGYQDWSVSRGLVDRVLADDELFDQHFIDHANAVLTGR
jgi:ABC-type nitrate/sulfonate/bicarbonate transport system substrate-binding protein